MCRHVILISFCTKPKEDDAASVEETCWFMRLWCETAQKRVDITHNISMLFFLWKAANSSTKQHFPLCRVSSTTNLTSLNASKAEKKTRKFSTYARDFFVPEHDEQNNNPQIVRGKFTNSLAVLCGCENWKFFNWKKQKTLGNSIKSLISLSAGLSTSWPSLSDSCIFINLKSDEKCRAENAEERHEMLMNLPPSLPSAEWKFKFSSLFSLCHFFSSSDMKLS